MISAACSHCKILVVAADSDDDSDLAAAVDTAVRLGAQVVSSSYGAPEGGAAHIYADAYDHPGHAIVVAAGDSGFGQANFPANLATVTAVGGTQLTRSPGKRGWAERIWNNGAGGAGASGCSAYVPKPSWQHDPHCGMRTIGDVSAVAAGLAIYDRAWGGWLTVAGTSAAAPLIAGVYGLAGNTATITPAYPCRHTTALFDVTAGNNIDGINCGGDYLCNAKKGYDAPTGLGTPDGTGAFLGPGLAIPRNPRTGTPARPPGRPAARPKQQTPRTLTWVRGVLDVSRHHNRGAARARPGGATTGSNADDCWTAAS